LAKAAQASISAELAAFADQRCSAAAGCHYEERPCLPEISQVVCDFSAGSPDQGFNGHCTQTEPR
jgi:hypothetical protein